MPHLCREWLDRVKRVEREHLVARLAVDRLVEAGSRDPGVLAPNLRRRDVQLADERLDGTYIIRLFAEFETGLRSFWRTIKRSEPSARSLLDGIAARRRISSEILIDVHAVREYRNQLVHEREDITAMLSLSEARRAICKYLSRLPEE